MYKLDTYDKKTITVNFKSLVEVDELFQRHRQ